MMEGGLYFQKLFSDCHMGVVEPEHACEYTHIQIHMINKIKTQK